MKGSNIFYVGLVTLAIGIYVARKSNEVVHRSVGSEMAKKDVALSYKSLPTQVIQAQTASPDKSEKALNPISPIEVETLRQRIPSKEQVKKEVHANPHGAPLSIIHFAETLGPMMEKALVNESDAKTLVDELQVCALNESADVTIRALCVSSAEKLSASHSHLRGRIDKIRDSVPEEILEMADARKILNQNGER